jgi:CRP-like cAMP-binding protein
MPFPATKRLSLALPANSTALSHFNRRKKSSVTTHDANGQRKAIHHKDHKKSTLLYSVTKHEGKIYSMIAKAPADRSAEDCEELSHHFLSNFRGNHLQALANLSNTDKLTIAKHMVLKQCVFKGEVIVRQGDEGQEFYFVFKGEYSVYVNQEGKGKVCKAKVATLHTGDYFGELALVQNEPRAASVIVDDPGELLIVTRDTYNLVFREQKLNKLRAHADFLSRCSFFNDREAWHVQDMEYLSQRIVFKTFPIDHVLWQAGDPISPIQFVPVIKRGEAELIITIDKPGEQRHVTICTVGPGAVLLDLQSIEAVDMSKHATTGAEPQAHSAPAKDGTQFTLIAHHVIIPCQYTTSIICHHVFALFRLGGGPKSTSQEPSEGTGEKEEGGQL